MKKPFYVLYLFAGLFFAKGLSAQKIANYVFSTDTLTYTDITDGTQLPLTSSNADNGTFNSIPVNFEFWYMGRLYNSVGISTNGWISLGLNETYLPNTYFTNTFSYSEMIIAPLWDDLDFNQSGGTISYKTTGVYPNRKFVVQWKNAEWPASANTAVISFQCMLHETTGRISFTYSGNAANPANRSASIGVSGFNSSMTYQFKALTGTGRNDSSSTMYDTDSISLFPPSGVVYSYTPPKLAAPVNAIFSSVTYNSMNIGWTDQTLEQGFVIYHSEDSIQYRFLQQLPINAITYLADSLKIANTHYFRIHTLSEGGLSEPLLATRSTPNGTMSGTYTVPGNYPSITAAVSAIFSNVLSGNTVIELQNTYTSSAETFPIVLRDLGFSSLSRKIMLRPASNAGNLSINSNNAGATFHFNGMKYFTIDGRPGGSGTLRGITIQNNSTSTSSYAILMNNDASYDTLIFCNITANGPAVVSISTTTRLTGNDNISIMNSHVYGGSSGRTFNLIVSEGNPGKDNDNLTVSNNHLYRFFRDPLATSSSYYTSAAIKIGPGCNKYNVTDNQIYQPSIVTTPSTPVQQSGVFFNNPNGTILVKGNYIGGSEPYCKGSPWTVGPFSTYNTIEGIHVVSSKNQQSVIENNTVSNFRLFTQSGGGVSISGNFGGIGQEGKCRIKNNVVGSLTDSTSIYMKNQGGQISMIFMSENDDTVSGNMIGSVFVDTSRTCAIYGIRATQYDGFTSNIFGNTIGGPGLYSGFFVSDNTSTVSNNIYGISCQGSPTSKVYIKNNVITNLASASTVLFSGVEGIVSGGLECTIEGNSISNFKSASTYYSCTGIDASAEESLIIKRNKIWNLSSTSLNEPIVRGIYVINGELITTNTQVSENLIHGLEVPDNATNAEISGIYVVYTNMNIYNNMVRLGIKNDGSSLTSPCTINGIYAGRAGTKSILHNSVYIGGSLVLAGSGKSSPLYAESPFVNYNNIYCNTRTNQGAAVSHYIMNANFASTAKSDYNLFYSGSAPARVSRVSLTYTLAAYRLATNLDSNSSENNPKFINATGNVNTVDLHIHPDSVTWAEGHGSPLYSVPSDFDGDIRTSPVDIGADAGSFTGVPVKLLSFTGKYTGQNRARLEWKTASENNNSHFDIERSYNGSSFTKIGRVRGNHTTNTLSAYTFEDLIPEEAFHMVYYRLKQVDYNGAYMYSDLLTLTLEKQTEEIAVYPNPFTDHIRLAVPASITGIITIKIYDAYGKVVQESSLLIEHNNLHPILNTTHLGPGIYIMELATGTGMVSILKLVK
ncbi:MAG: T9SS type A sorting domain-containing protein [Bacteroidota bacterium]